MPISLQRSQPCLGLCLFDDNQSTLRLACLDREASYDERPMAVRIDRDFDRAVAEKSNTDRSRYDNLTDIDP